MIVLIGISLVTVVGLFFLYRVMAGDQPSQESSPDRNIIAASPKVSVSQETEAEAKPRKKLFAFPALDFFTPQEEKVEPILSLKDYADQKSKEEMVEEYDLSAIQLKREHEKSDAQPSASASEKPFDVKERLAKLEADYLQMDRLLHERTAELTRMQKIMESETKVRRDFDRVRETLEAQLKEAHRQNSEKAKLIDALKKAIVDIDVDIKPKSSAQNSSSFEQQVSRDFVNLPPDVIQESQKESRKSQAEDYQMSSEKEILRRLMENKKNL